MKTYNVISNYTKIFRDEHSLVIADLESDITYYMTKKYYYKCECSYAPIKDTPFLFSVALDKTSKSNYIKANKMFFLEYEEPTIYL